MQRQQRQATTDRTVPLRDGPPCADMKIHQLVEWTPRWSRHKFVLLGNESWASRMAMNYDSGRAEGAVSDRLLRMDFDLLVDVGAAYGYYPCLLKSQQPGLRVVAVEADPTRYGCLLRNTSFYHDVDAIYGMAGSYDLCLNNVDSMCDVRKTGTPPVLNHYSLEALRSRHPDAGVVLFKIDVEGGEGLILKDSAALIADPTTRWVVEYHKWGPMPLPELLDLFRASGRSPVWELHSGGNTGHIFVD